MAAQDRIDRGESPAEANRAASREFGNVALVKEVTRDTWSWTWLEPLLQDVRYGVRMLAKSPLYTAIAVVTLALGIGANTALFSVVNGVLLNPLPFSDADQLVGLHENKPNFEGGSISYLNFRDWQHDNHTFEAMAIARPISFMLSGSGPAELVLAQFVSEDFFPLLGVHPAIGRGFTLADEQVGAAPVALISAGLWERKFGRSPDILGKTLTLDARNFTIIGVIPASFHLRIIGFRERDLYVPFGQWNNTLFLNRGAGLGIHGIGKLKPGVTLQQARADMDAVTRNLAAAYPNVNQDVSAMVAPLKQQMVGGVRSILLMLLAAVACVLLIACVNVANLLLARATTRAREFAIRSALGATRRRMLRQLLTESVLLAFLGGTLGVLLAMWGTHAALAKLPMQLPRADEIHVDGRVLFVAVAISLFSGILFGLAPALKNTQTGLHDTLKEAGRGIAGVRHRAQRAFVVIEMALALVLLAGAGLMVRSITLLWKVDPGFNPKNLLNYSLGLPPNLQTENAARTRAAIREYDNRIRSLSGVEAISQSWGAIPLGGDDEQLFWLEGQPKPSSDKDKNWAIDYIVEPEYLKVMQLRLLRGRFLSEQDDEHAPHVVVVDDVFAAKFFPGQDPIGKRIVLNGEESVAEIVGIVGHVKQWALDTDDTQSVRAELYLAGMQMPDSFLGMAGAGSVLVRSPRASAGLFDAIRKASEDRTQEVVFGAYTMEDYISQSLSDRSFSMMLLGAFAGVSLILTSVGIYGVISYIVGQRTHEIGIRMALGAQHRDVLRLILGQGGRLAALGIAIGCLAAFALMPLLNSFLFNVKPSDPLTFVFVAALLGVVALFACYLPARRALRIDPQGALRCE